MAHDTLILCKPLADFGEALKKECPQNDCIVYRNIYERYCERYADYKRIKAAVANYSDASIRMLADLSDATIRTLEHGIRADEKELYEMWANNYAVLKQRGALGMCGKRETPKAEKTTVFEAVTKDAATLAGLLRSLPVLQAPWDTEFHKRFCSSCDAENCDVCPNEQFRSNPEWWLSLLAEGAEL